MTLVRPLKARRSSHIWACFDIETRGFDGDCCLVSWMTPEGDFGWVSDNEVSDPLDAFCDVVLSSPGVTWYAHAGGVFDTLHLLPRLIARGCEIDIVLQGSRILIAEIKGSQVRIQDSYSLLPFRLKDLPGLMDLETTKGECDFEYLANGGRVTDEIVEYCVDDTRVLGEALNAFFETLREIAGGANVVAPTLASIASKLWRTCYLTRPIDRAPDAIDEEHRKAYSGGAVIAGYIGRVKGVRGYDINSSYPTAMRRLPLPEGPTRSGKPYRNLPDSGGFGLGYVSALVSIPIHERLPCLPYRQGNRLIFPVGTFRGHWALEEVLYARERGYKFTDIRYVPYKEVPPSETGLPEFCDTLYQLRQRGGAYKLVAKLIMNALYGKFGQKREHKRYKLVNARQFEPEIGDIVHGDCDVMVVENAEESRGAIENYLSAASITANARVRLFAGMHATEEAGNPVIYCDTDSIYCQGRGSVEIGPELGKWEQCFGPGRFAIWGPKFYAGKDSNGIIAKAKGMNVGDGPGAITPEQILRGELIESSREGLGKFKSLLPKGGSGETEWKLKSTTLTRKPRLQMQSRKSNGMNRLTSPIRVEEM